MEDDNGLIARLSLDITAMAEWGRNKPYVIDPEEFLFVPDGRCGYVQEALPHKVIGTAGIGPCLGILGYQSKAKAAFLAHIYYSRVHLVDLAFVLKYFSDNLTGDTSNAEFTLLTELKIFAQEAKEYLIGERHVAEGNIKTIIGHNQSIALDVRSGKKWGSLEGLHKRNFKFANQSF